MVNDGIICVYCKKKAELMKSDLKTVVICSRCGIAIDLKTYKELFDNLVWKNLSDENQA